MNAIADGLGALAEPGVLAGMLLGTVLGMLVGTFPGISVTMAVALASGFTLTLEPVQGLAVLLPIYVAASFGDRVPAILINTPGTPASIASTFDGFPLARQGKAGLALTVSAVGSLVGGLAGIVLFVVAADPLADAALRFGPAEMFALVVFGLTMMVSVAEGQLVKGLFAGLAGLLLGVVGLDPITGDPRMTFGLDALTSGLPFIAVIIGLFGIAEVFEQMLTHREGASTVVTQMGRWTPTREERRLIRKPIAMGSGIGVVVGAMPAAGGDIAGLVSWSQARRSSKRPEEFGKGSLEGLAAADTANNAQVGGALITSFALGLPGDSVSAVLLGSMIIWGLTPGPTLFRDHPDLIATVSGILLLATVLAFALSLLRLRGVVRLLDLPRHYLWGAILVCCAVGTYSINNRPGDVLVMLIAGLVGLAMRRYGFPAGPLVLGLLLGPLAEANLRRALVIGGPGEILTSPIAGALLAVSALALAWPFLSRRRRRPAVDPREPADMGG
ncbi:tripartite tricarboxylate transporter permease [Actinomadura sp. 1N219]|uniref:tripartite tricarboxylate transporter permease n=1 Tax=Actinomadura sp. 1N219 TaxID=3375152 RepID=UPI0037A5E7B3